MSSYYSNALFLHSHNYPFNYHPSLLCENLKCHLTEMFHKKMLLINTTTFFDKMIWCRLINRKNDNYDAETAGNYE